MPRAPILLPIFVQDAIAYGHIPDFLSEYSIADQVLHDSSPSTAPVRRKTRIEAGCPLEAFPVDILRLVTRLLSQEDVFALWNTNSQKLRRLLAVGGVSELHGSLTSCHSPKWPAYICDLPNLTELHISSVLYYEHVPVNGFTPVNLPSKYLNYLDLSFGNAMDFLNLFSTENQLASLFPSLKSLALTAKIHQNVTAKHLALLEGLTRLNAPIFIAMADIGILPRSLYHLSKLTIDESDRREPMAESLPPALVSLKVSCGDFGGVLLDGISKSQVRLTLQDLDLQCDVDRGSETKPIMSDALLSQLPRTLRHLRLTLGLRRRLYHGLDLTPALSNVGFGCLPPELQTLIIVRGEGFDRIFMLHLTCALFVSLPRTLRTLDLPELYFNGSWEDVAPQYGFLPPGLTTLGLLSRNPILFSERAGLQGVLDPLPLTTLRFHLDITWNLAPSVLGHSITSLEVPTVKEMATLPSTLRSLKLERLIQPHGHTDVIPRILSSLPSSLTSFEVEAAHPYAAYGFKAWPNSLTFLALQIREEFHPILVKKLPPTLVFLHLVDEDNTIHIEYLPRNLTSLKLRRTDTYMTPPQFPPRLVTLCMTLGFWSAREWSSKVWTNISPTLKELGIWYTTGDCYDSEEEEIYANEQDQLLAHIKTNLPTSDIQLLEW